MSNASICSTVIPPPAGYAIRPGVMTRWGSLFRGAKNAHAEGHRRVPPAGQPTAVMIQATSAAKAGYVMMVPNHFPTNVFTGI